MSGCVLVTGGLGYVGGRVVQTLRHAGLPVSVTSSRAVLEHTAGEEAPRALPLPCTPQVADVAMRGVDCVVHLAAVNEIRSAEDPEHALLVNGLGTLQLLRAASRNAVRRFVYVSTAHVYGRALTGTVTERTVPDPTHPYAITHHVAEEFALAEQRAGGLQTAVLRLSNGIGAPARADVNRWTLVGNDLCRQAVTEGRLTLHTSGLQWRDFIPLSDVASAIAHVLCMPAASLADGLFNLGGGTPLRIIDLAERIATRATRLLGRSIAVHSPPADGAMPLPSLDYRRDRLLATGFKPGGDIDGEIDRTLELCRGACGPS